MPMTVCSTTRTNTMKERSGKPGNLSIRALSKVTAAYYSCTSCLSIDPEVIIRMIVGLLPRIRSERQLGEEVQISRKFFGFL